MDRRPGYYMEQVVPCFEQYVTLINSCTIQIPNLTREIEREIEMRQSLAILQIFNYPIILSVTVLTVIHWI